MTLDYTFDRERQLVVISGDYEGAPGWQQLLVELRRELKSRRDVSIIRDARKAGPPPSGTMVTAVFELLRRFSADMRIRRWALVIDDDSDPIAMALEMLAQRKGVALELFTSMRDALEWAQQPRVAAPTV